MPLAVSTKRPVTDPSAAGETTRDDLVSSLRTHRCRNYKVLRGKDKPSCACATAQPSDGKSDPGTMPATTRCRAEGGTHDGGLRGTDGVPPRREHAADRARDVRVRLLAAVVPRDHRSGGAGCLVGSVRRRQQELDRDHDRRWGYDGRPGC